MPAVSVNGTATKIVGFESKRKSLIIFNNSPSETIYLGEDSSVTTANGIPLGPKSNFIEDNGDMRMYMGDFYGISSGETVDVRYWERTR